VIVTGRRFGGIAASILHSVLMTCSDDRVIDVTFFAVNVFREFMNECVLLRLIIMVSSAVTY